MRAECTIAASPSFLLPGRSDKGTKSTANLFSIDTRAISALLRTLNGTPAVTAEAAAARNSAHSFSDSCGTASGAVMASVRSARYLATAAVAAAISTSFKEQPEPMCSLTALTAGSGSGLDHAIRCHAGTGAVSTTLGRVQRGRKGIRGLCADAKPPHSDHSQDPLPIPSPSLPFRPATPCLPAPQPPIPSRPPPSSSHHLLASQLPYSMHRVVVIITQQKAEEGEWQLEQVAQ